MNMRQLEIFHAVMKAGTLTQAARMLNISQPAISRALRHTEDRLGIRLFDRIRGRLYPTPEAEALLPEVQGIFSRVESLGRTTQALRDARSGDVSVAATPTLVNSIVPLAVSRFREQRPNVRFTIHSLPTDQVIDHVLRREADLGLVYSPTREALLERETLMVSEVACVLPPGHALAGRETVHAEDLLPLPIITYGEHSPLGFLIHRAFQSCGRLPEIGIRVSFSLTACILANVGAGAALVDPFMVRSGAFPNLLVKPFRPEVEMRMELLFAREVPRSRLTILFADQLREVAAEDRAATHGIFMR